MAVKKGQYMYIAVFAIVLICVIGYVVWPRRHDHRDEAFTAIIIEPRKHRAFEFVLRNFLENLDSRWKIMVFHGTQNETFVNDIIAATPVPARVSTVNMGVANLTKDTYSDYMISTDFLYRIPTEVFLIFQSDSMICPEFKDTINQFIEYEYVGAPWPSDRFPARFYRNGSLVGNGGLSLRRKTKMLEILKKCEADADVPEDVYFSMGCKGVHVYKPSESIAAEFSMEMIYSPKSFGLHRTWHVDNVGPEHIDQIEGQCRGYKTLMELNT
jgi:cbb3-type cytochrome oxidase subunit 3